MIDKRSSRDSIKNCFDSYFSRLQKQHDEQMAAVHTLSDEIDSVYARLDKLRANLDNARHKLSKSQSTEQSEFVEMKRTIEALLEAIEKNTEVAAGPAPGGDEIE